MTKWLGTLGFILLMGFVAYILFASTPKGRIERACLPVEWGSKVVTSAARVMKRSWGEPVREWGNKGVHSCRYWMFDVFYAEDWARQKAAAEAARQQGE